jgi:transposase
MSTSLLYHAWGLRGYRLEATDFAGGATVFRVRQNDDTLCCGHCGGRDVMREGVVVRRFRTLPIGRKPVWLELPVQRLWCANCNKTRQVKLAFADDRRTYTHSFERYALELGRHMTIQDVAQHLGVSWDVIKDIQKRYLLRHYAKPRLKHLRQIAIDEISIGRGQRFLTVVLDLDSGAVVFVGEGRGTASLEPFWKRLRSSGAKVQAVATDMSPAYILAIHDNLPKAVHVFDRFHVMMLFNEQLADLRREVQRSVEDVEQRRLLKGTLWLLLKNPENLNPKKNERQRLEDALRINQPLATAYYMREDLREFWNQLLEPLAARFLDDWIARAQASGIKMLQKFARTLQVHRTGLLNWYKCPISTGPLEGTNTKIRVLQRQAYGFRDREFFKLKIYALHETTYALVG